jgi:hypothetical protein
MLKGNNVDQFIAFGQEPFSDWTKKFAEKCTNAKNWFIGF